MIRKALDTIVPAPVRHPITVEEYDHMVLAGVFTKDARLELINGELIEMTPIGSPHSSRVDRLNMWFVPQWWGGRSCGSRDRSAWEAQSS